MARPEYYGFSSRQRPARRRSGWQGSMRLGALFAILVGVNIYVFFFRGGTSIQDVLQTGAIKGKAPKVSVSAASAAVSPRRAGKREAMTPASNDDSLVVQGGMKGHLGLSSALSARNLDDAQVAELIASLKPVLNMRSLRPEHDFEARLDPTTKQVRKFTYRLSPISAVVVQRRANGKLAATKQEVELKTRRIKIGGTVTSSLNRAVSKVGERSALVARFVELFNWDVNWYADPRAGDQFRIVVEKKYKGDDFYRYGRILAAEYQGKVGRFQAFHYKRENGEGGYFTPEGRSVRRAFLKTPLNFRRISSKFNARRFHPVLHRTKGHYGVDYAAARGTPIFAAADGVVRKAGRFGGAGNMVALQHAGGINTQYMHMTRIAAGLRRGSKVRQRQVIGTVGSTGLATGPHLHYGITRHGRHLDPLKFKISKGALLPRRDRIRYLDGLRDRMAELEAISTTE